MTLLDLIKTFCSRTGIPVPSFAIGNTDPQVVQLLGLLDEILEDLVNRTRWAASTQEVVFTSVAGEDQGFMTTLAPFGFKWIVKDTFFDRTLRRPMFGPLTATQWQTLKALPNPGPYYKYRIVGQKLLINPAAEAGHILAFEYASCYLIRDVDGVTLKAIPTADTDTFLDDTLALAGLRWKWKYEKGLDYAEDFRRFEELADNTKGREGSAQTLCMDSVPISMQPGIFVSPGTWPL